MAIYSDSNIMLLPNNSSAFTTNVKNLNADLFWIKAQPGQMTKAYLSRYSMGKLIMPQLASGVREMKVSADHSRINKQKTDGQTKDRWI